VNKKTKNQSKKTNSFFVVELLNSFTKRELADFASFIACDYHNTDLHVVNLLDALTKQVIHQKAFDEALQSMAYCATFPKKSAPKKSLNSQQKALLLAKMAVLTRLAETFLMYEELKENAACKTELLYPQLLKRKQFALFHRNMTKDDKALNGKTAKGVRDYAQKFRMESEHLLYLHHKELLRTEDNMPELIESLDVCYLINKLKVYISCVALARISAKKSYDMQPIEATTSLLNLPQYAEHPLIHIHKVALDLLQKNTLRLYEELIQLLNTNEKFISNNDLNDLYKIAVNFCSKKIKEGHSEFYQHALDIYRIMDSKNLLTEGNFMPINKLKNIITLACRLNEFDWAKESIEKYRPNLKKAHANSVYHFNMGLVAFYKNDFKTALSHFIRVEKVNLAYDINCRIMLLKSHYELDHEYDERSIRTFLLSERFIQSHKGLITRDKKAYKNFVRILINIYNTRHGAGKMTAEKVRRKLEKLEFVSDKKWLEEKIEGLEKSASSQKRRV